MLDQDAPSLGAVIAASIDVRLLGIHTHLPARVESFDANTQRASVQIELRAGRFDEDGSRTPVRYPVIPDVPVKFEGSGGYRTTYPVQRGDQVWLEICEASLALWKPRGGDVDPADDRRMRLSDALAVTGLRDGSRPLKNCPTDRMSVGHDEGATVEITPTAVLVGGNGGTQPTHMGTSYNSATSTFITALNVYLAAIVAALPPPPVLAGPTATYNAATATFLAAATASLTVIAQVK